MLQNEMKQLSDQINKAVILSPEEINTQEVGPGTTCIFETDSNETVTYTFLGPWDANTEQNILSYKSKMAEAMAGHKVGESFNYQGKSFTVKSIKNGLK